MKKRLAYSLIILCAIFTQAKSASLDRPIEKIENNSHTSYYYNDGYTTGIITPGKIKKISVPLALPLEMRPVKDSSKPSFKIEKTETDYKTNWDAVRSYKVTSTNKQSKTFSIPARLIRSSGLMIRIDNNDTVVVTHCYK